MGQAPVAPRRLVFDDVRRCREMEADRADLLLPRRTDEPA